MTVLVGGLRALGVTARGTQHGVLTDRPGQLTNDFFVNLLSPGARWVASQSDEGVYEIRDVGTDDLRATATAVDLVFGSNSQLRALAEVYASADARREVRHRLRRRVDQGHGGRPLRPPRLTRPRRVVQHPAPPTRPAVRSRTAGWVHFRPWGLPFGPQRRNSGRRTCRW